MELAWAVHPELRGIDYDDAEMKSGVNWHLHLTLDAVVLRRMSDSTLPDARIVQTLWQRGIARREAIHRIAAILAETIWHMDQSWKAGVDSSPDVAGRDSGGLNDAINAKINALI